MPGAPNPLAPGMGPQVVNRRMNAIKTNHPKDMIGPNMGKLYDKPPNLLISPFFEAVDKNIIQEVDDLLNKFNESIANQRNACR